MKELAAAANGPVDADELARDETEAKLVEDDSVAVMKNEEGGSPTAPANGEEAGEPEADEDEGNQTVPAKPVIGGSVVGSVAALKVQEEALAEVKQAYGDLHDGAVQTAIRIGRAMIRVREATTRRREFWRWAREHIAPIDDSSDKTLKRFMQIAELDKVDQFRGHVTALYEFVDVDAPSGAWDEVLRISKNAGFVRRKDARELLGRQDTATTKKTAADHGQADAAHDATDDAAQAGDAETEAVAEDAQADDEEHTAGGEASDGTDGKDAGDGADGDGQATDDATQPAGPADDGARDGEEPQEADDDSTTDVVVETAEGNEGTAERAGENGEPSPQTAAVGPKQAEVKVQAPLPRCQPESVTIHGKRWKTIDDGNGFDIDDLLRAVDPASSTKPAMCLLGVPGPGLREGLQIMKKWGFTFQTTIVPGTTDRKLQLDENLGLSSVAHLILVGVRGCRPDMSGHDSVLDPGVGSLEKTMTEMARKCFPEIIKHNVID